MLKNPKLLWLPFHSRRNAFSVVLHSLLYWNWNRASLIYIKNTANGPLSYYKFFFRINESFGIHVEVCQPQCNKTSKFRPCIRKCCSLGTSINILMEGCSPTGERDWKPFFYRDPFTILKDEEQGKFKPHFIQSPPSCDEHHPLYNRHLPNSTKQP